LGEPTAQPERNIFQQLLENCCSEDLPWGSERDILASRAYQAMVNMSKKHIAHTKEYSLLYD
jgi:hypothetical protein